MTDSAHGETELTPGYGNSYALLVGINSYQDPRFVPLGEAEQDAQRLMEVLQAPPHDFLVRCIMGEAATKEAILRSMYDLRETDANDRILVYFACHGYTLTDKFGKESGYLAMADTMPDMDFTALHLEEVINLRRYANAKHITFVFDACFSGQALGLTRSVSVSAEKFLTRRAYQVISAGAGDQTVADFDSMTDVMVEVLSGSMISEDGIFTTSELGQYLQTVMAADSGQMQIPQFGHLRGSQGGDFIFFIDEKAVLPPEVIKALHSENVHLRYGGVSALIDLIDSGTLEENDMDIAIRTLREAHQTETDPHIMAIIEQFFELEEARLLCDTGDITVDEVAALVERSQEQRKEVTRDVVEKSTGTGISVDSLIDLVETVPTPTHVDLAPRLRPKPQPSGRLGQWGSVKTRIDDVLGALSEGSDNVPDHAAPTQARQHRLGDLEALIEEAKARKKGASDGWDDREEWQ
jgi:hypothetical protein